MSVRSMLALVAITGAVAPHALLAVAHATSTTLDRTRAFERVYEEGRWVGGVDGARCASGWSDVSSGQGAAAMRAVLHVIDTYQIDSMLDVPCGDGCFAGALLGALQNHSAPGGHATVRYEGIDIVNALVVQNRAQLGGPAARFSHADAVTGIPPLPPADLLFSRQMMQHLCNADVLRFIRQAARSSARYVLFTTFVTDEPFANSDISCDSGGYRPQDLTKPPFSLPTPIAVYREEYPTDPRTALGLWPTRALRRRLLR